MKGSKKYIKIRKIMLNINVQKEITQKAVLMKIQAKQNIMLT